MQTPLWFEEDREKPESTELFDFVPHLSLSERDRRWAELRRRMVFRGLDCLIFFGNDAAFGRGMVNFRYITHFASAMGGFAIFPLDGDPIIFSGPPHLHVPYNSYRSLQNWVEDIRPNTGVNTVIDCIKKMGLDRGRIGIVAYSTANAAHTLPYYNYTKLNEGLSNATFSDETVLLEEMRQVKSSEEIAFLQKASQIARKKIDAMIEATRPGVKEADIWATMIATDISNGGEPQIFNLLSSGNVFEKDEGYKHLLHGSEQPGSPTMRPIQNGDLIMCEFHSVYGGYMAATEFSLFVGEPPQELVDIHKACIGSLEAAMETMKPGNTVRQVWDAMIEPAESRGFDYIELGFHGHGLASPEYPTVVYRPGDGALSGGSTYDLPLQEDMVLGTNIDIHNPNWRKDVGIMIGDMFHVTSNGPRRLVEIPTDFICVKV
jgi:Xaa-Pro aminopeptidase